MPEKIREMIIAKAGETGAEITRDTVLASDLGLNSFDLADLVCEIEDEYGIEIPDKVLPSLLTVGDVLDYLESH